MTEPPFRSVHRPTFAAVLVLATTSGFFSLFAVSVLAPFIIADLDLSRAAYGSLSAVIFASGSILSGLAGRLMGTLSSRTSLLVLFAVSALSWGLIAGASNYAMLLVGGAVAGVPLALALPVTTRLVRAEVAPGRRGAFLGIAQSGSQVGGLVAGASLPVLAVHLGWRLALVVTGVIALFGAALTSRTHLGDTQVSKAATGRSANREVIVWLSLYGFTTNAGVTIATVYLPIFAYESLAMSVELAGGIAVLIALIAFVTKVLWGRVTESSRNVCAPLLVVGLSGTLAMSALAGATPETSWLLWLGVVLFAVSGVSWAVVTMTAIARLIEPEEVVRTASSVMLSSFMGAALAPIGFGWIVDLGGDYASAWLATAGLFGVASGVMVAWTLKGRAAARGVSGGAL